MRDSVDQRLISWVSEIGFNPITLPNSLAEIDRKINDQLKLDQWISSLKINGIILSGGNNIGDIKERDITETYLLKYAETNEIPVLGICRGMQMLAVYDGAKLKKVPNHTNVIHALITFSDTNFPSSVNSYHDFSIANCPDSYKITATSLDNEIEAISHRHLPWEGWMWHPERDDEISSINSDRFKKLICYEK